MTIQASRSMFRCRAFLPSVLLGALLCFSLVACGGGKRIDWEARVGVYTLAQAQDEYGEPQGFQDLSDGTRLYLWYDYGSAKWHNVLALIFDNQGRLVKMERDQR